MKAILFDYHGVLGHWDDKIFFSNISKMFDLEFNLVSKLFYDDGWLDKVEGGKNTSDDIISELNNLSGKKIDKKEFINTLENVYFDYESTIDLLKSLKPNYKIYLTEHAMDIDLNWQKEKLPSFAYFDKIYTSHEIKARKNTKEFFERVLEDTNLKPDDVYYFDDGQKYVDIAKSLGINAYLYKDINQIKEIIK